MSPSAATIFVFLSSPNLSFISSNSSLMMLYTKWSLARISFSLAISFINSLYSSSIFSLCNPDKRFNCMSKIACACISDSPNLSINLSFASSYAERMICITSSILSIAIFKPSNICALASALSSSNFVLRSTTVFLWSM